MASRLRRWVLRIVHTKSVGQHAFTANIETLDAIFPEYRLYVGRKTDFGAGAASVIVEYDKRRLSNIRIYRYQLRVCTN
jgi:hypothetical protein